MPKNPLERRSKTECSEQMDSSPTRAHNERVKRLLAAQPGNVVRCFERKYYLLCRKIKHCLQLKTIFNLQVCCRRESLCTWHRTSYWQVRERFGTEMQSLRYFPKLFRTNHRIFRRIPEAFPKKTIVFPKPSRRKVPVFRRKGIVFPKQVRRWYLVFR